MATRRTKARTKVVEPSEKRVDLRDAEREIYGIDISEFLHRGLMSLSPEMINKIKSGVVATFKAAGVSPALIEAFKRAEFSPVGPPWRHMGKRDAANLQAALRRAKERMEGADQHQLERDIMLLLNRKYGHLDVMEICVVMANIILPISFSAFGGREEVWRGFWLSLVKTLPVPVEVLEHYGKKAAVVKETIH